MINSKQKEGKTAEDHEESRNLQLATSDDQNNKEKQHKAV
jgi:hypothetical protein